MTTAKIHYTNLKGKVMKAKNNTQKNVNLNNVPATQETTANEYNFLESFLKPYLVRVAIEKVQNNVATVIETKKYELLFNCLSINNFKVIKYGQDKEVQSRLPNGTVLMNDDVLYKIIKKMTTGKTIVIHGNLNGFVAYTATKFWYFPIETNDDLNVRLKVLSNTSTEIVPAEKK